MRKLFIPTLLLGLPIAGCSRQAEPEKVASLQAQVQTLETENEKLQAENDTLHDQRTDYDTQVRELTNERDRLLGQVRDLEARDTREPAPVETTDETPTLKKRIAELEAEIETLKAEASPAAETETVEAPPEVEVDPEVKRQLADLLPLVKGETSTDSLEKLVGTLERADEQTRIDYVEEMRNWVKNDPESKHAHLALALTLTARFQDLEGDIMKQAALAGEVAEETNKAIEIDPEFYEAVHFLGILQVNYPSFTPEFKEANKTLDRALEMQAEMTWEDDFAEIYAAYGMWYRVQKKYDDAAAKVQAGLDLAPRNQGLLDEQQRIEDARNAEEE